MLILSRKNGESIVIDGGIRVTVNAIKGHVVKFGIEAPKETPIHRGEIYEKIRQSAPDLLAGQNSRRVAVGAP
jgi:carbon storage regulator